MASTKVTLLFIGFLCICVTSVYSSSIPTYVNLNDVQSSGKLVFANVIYRHGDRNPGQQNPGDKYDISYWPEGWGQLTKIGKQQHFALGQWFRKRYNNFISTTFNVSDIYVRSTDMDRTLMSAQANLAGFFPPKGNQIWNNNLIWQPIPIHSMPLTTDPLIGWIISPCAAYENAFNEYLASTEIKRFGTEMQPIYDYLTKNSGVAVNDFISVLMFRDAWLCESKHNLTLPEWSKSLFPNNEKFNKAAIKYYYLASATKFLAKFSSGFLLKDMLDRFTSKIQKSLVPDLKLWMYSAHDATLFSFLNSLDILDNDFVPYAASVLVELRYYMNEYYVQIFYKKTDETPNPINIPGCGIACPLSRMYQIYNNILPKNDFNTECLIK